MIRFIIILLISSFSYGQMIIDSYRFAAPAATNYYTYLDAAAPVGETNTIDAGWETSSIWSWTSNATSPYDGSYSIEYERLTAGNTEKGFVISGIPVSTAFTISVWVYVPTAVGSNPRMRTRTFDGWAGDYIQVFTGARDTWVNYTLAITSNATVMNRTFNFEHIDTTIGTKFKIDKIELTAN